MRLGPPPPVSDGIPEPHPVPRRSKTCWCGESVDHRHGRWVHVQTDQWLGVERRVDELEDQLAAAADVINHREHRDDDGLPDQCVSSITVGQSIYWCDRGQRGHEGLCGGSDSWGGHAEWRWWSDRNGTK